MRLGVRVGKGGIQRLMNYYSLTDREYYVLNSTPISNVREGMIVLIDVHDDTEHVVMPFETMDSIAHAYNVSPDYLREYNGMDSVFVGDRVHIPEPHIED